MSSYKELDLHVSTFLKNQKNSLHWLMNQSTHSAEIRREILEYLPIKENANLIDIGTGFGPISFDLAVQRSVHIQAIDHDMGKIETAAKVQEHVQEKMTLPGNIQFQQADVYQLPFEDDTFDFAISFFVFQHLHHPQNAIQEILRVLKPGGMLCIVDVDDQYTIAYPEKSNAQKKISRGFQRLQEAEGGDRYIGRKLSTYMEKQGFEMIATFSRVLSGHVPSSENKSYDLNFYFQQREQFIKHNIMTLEEFDECIETIKNETDTFSQFKSIGLVIALGFNRQTI